MTPATPAEPTPRALGESLSALATQIADLRGQIRTISGRLDQAGLHANVNLPARFEELAQTVAEALEAAAPRGPVAPYWVGLDRDAYATRLADLRQTAAVSISVTCCQAGRRSRGLTTRAGTSRCSVNGLPVQDRSPHRFGRAYSWSRIGPRTFRTSR